MKMWMVERTTWLVIHAGNVTILIFIVGHDRIKVISR